MPFLQKNCIFSRLQIDRHQIIWYIVLELYPMWSVFR